MRDFLSHRRAGDDGSQAASFGYFYSPALGRRHLV